VNKLARIQTARISTLSMRLRSLFYFSRDNENLARRLGCINWAEPPIFEHCHSPSRILQKVPRFKRLCVRLMQNLSLLWTSNVDSLILNSYRRRVCKELIYISLESARTINPMEPKTTNRAQHQNDATATPVWKAERRCRVCTDLYGLVSSAIRSIFS
jgi:hypothetical protein